MPIGAHSCSKVHKNGSVAKVAAMEAPMAVAATPRARRQSTRATGGAVVAAGSPHQPRTLAEAQRVPSNRPKVAPNDNCTDNDTGACGRRRTSKINASHQTLKASTRRSSQTVRACTSTGCAGRRRAAISPKAKHAAARTIGAPPPTKATNTSSATSASGSGGSSRRRLSCTSHDTRRARGSTKSAASKAT